MIFRTAGDLRRLIFGLGGLIGLAGTTLPAQTFLLSEQGSKMYVVRQAQGTRPMIEIDGKLVEGPGLHFALKPTEDFLPVFIAVSNLSAGTTAIEADGASINNEFSFAAQFSSPYRLKDVFLVLEMSTEAAGKVLFLQEVGQLEPGKFKTLSIHLPIPREIGRGNYIMHLYAGGQEALHSEMPPEYRDQRLDGMIARRVSGVLDAPPKLFTGPAPVYPEKLAKTNSSGTAVITIRIGANGRVYNPQVLKASAPAFGEAALDAVRLWRFLPRVKNNFPVETTVDVPFNFTPPGDSAK